MITINSLKNVPDDMLFEAFEDAFSEYEMQLDQIELSKMLKRRGFQTELSFGAFYENKLVAFTFNGIGPYQGIKTAYDTGTGTIKEYRGLGLASRIFEHSIPYLKAEGVKQYLLEVLQSNDKAVSLYKKLGFKITREFDYFVVESKNLNQRFISLSKKYSLNRISLPDPELVHKFEDVSVSWQNSFDSIYRCPENFLSNGIFCEGELVGYIVFEPASGDISRLAIEKAHRRKGLGSLLLNSIQGEGHTDSIKIINIQIGANGIAEFLKSNNINPSGKQFEMIRTL